MPRYCSSSSSSSSHEDVIGFKFVGVKIRVLTGHNLGAKKFKSKINPIDPYLVMGFGNMNHVVKGRTHKKAGQNLKFDEEFYVEWDKVSRHIKVVAMDKDTFSRDDQLGVGKIDCAALQGKPGRHEVPLFRDGADAGHLEIMIDFVAEPILDRVSKPKSSSSSSSCPSSEITFMGVEVIVKSGENLGGKHAPSKMNPFLVVRLSGQTYKGRVHRHCRPNMRFGECFRMPYDGKSRSVKICVIDRDRDGDDVLGVGKLDIPAIVHNPGNHEVPLFDRQGRDMGHLNVKVDFMAERMPACVVLGSSSSSR